MPAANNDLHCLRIITQKELRGIVPYTPQHILRLEKSGRFPLRIRLGQNRVGWRLIEIEAWIASRLPSAAPQSDQQHPPSV